MTTRYLVFLAATTIFLLTVGCLRRFLPFIPQYNTPKTTPYTSILTPPNPGAPTSHDFFPEIQGRTLALSDQQCTTYFPGLFDELDIAVARGPLAKPSHSVGNSGIINGRIWDGKLYVTGVGKNVWSRQSAIFHQIHRAIMTAPDPREIPNISFTVSVNDHPGPDTWSLARSDAEKEVHTTWLMPDYGFWSWPEPHIGTLLEAREKIAKIDGPLSWDDKDDRAVFRGSKHWNGALRGKLLEVAGGKEWADAQVLEWGVNSLGMEDFCKYKFLVYTEGVTYSGRLMYFLHCRSIIISPPLQWHQIHSPLLRTEGPDQNIVIVKEDWSDLQETVDGLLADPERAERIADNTVKTFRDRYLTPAAETCYWRKMFRAWASVTPSEKEVPAEERGTSWESYVLMGKMEWDSHA